MFDIWIAFITGLTTGGLSCMAVQGGLIASSLASQVEKDLQDRPVSNRARPQLAMPIAVFLLAKLAAYTLLGFLLGALGSTLSLTPMMRAILQFAIGVFMIGNGLRMFNVHPIFRYFNFEPPAFVRRFIRQSSKGKTSFASPEFLGAMTVLIPCGIAQSMMAVSLGTANPIAGAGIMFSFTLGTSPVFFALAYSAARLGAVMEKYFMRLVAMVLLILGVYAIDTGLNLSGAPFSFSIAVQGLSNLVNPLPATNAAAVADLTLRATDDGYLPSTLYALAEHPVKLKIVTENTMACTLAFTIPELDVSKDLPITGNVSIDIPAQPKDKVIRFSCSMGMYPGRIIFR